MERKDGWNSALSGIGNPEYDKRVNSKFSGNTLSHQDSLDLWRGDDLAARIIEVPADEMVRQGFELNIPEDKKLQEEVTGIWESLGVIDKLREGVEYERGYGGSGTLIGANDGMMDLREPLIPERVKSVDFLTVLEPDELMPLLWYTDPRDPKFGQPGIFQLNPLIGSGNSGIDIHESRLIIRSGIVVSRRQIQATGWGDSVLNRVYAVLRDYNMTWAAASSLMQDFAQAVFKMKGLAEALVMGKDELIQNRIKAVQLSRSTVRAVLLDSEEEFERKQTPLSGMPQMLDRFNVRLSAAAGMPVTVLMGISPAGLNATGESDLQLWYDKIRSQQGKKIIPSLTYITKLILYSLTNNPPKWSIKACPLWQESDGERENARKTRAETDAIEIGAGIVSADEVARSRHGSDGYSFETHIDWDEREKLLDLNDDMGEEVVEEEEPVE